MTQRYRSKYDSRYDSQYRSRFSEDHRSRSRERDGRYSSRLDNGRNNLSFDRKSNIFQTPRGPGRWLFVLIAVVLVAIAGITFAACNSGGHTDAASQSASTSTSSTATSTTSTATATTPATTTTQEQDAIAGDARTLTSSNDNTTKPTSKVVYLTFDDGPSGNTQKILDILNQYGVKATWFVIGNAPDIGYVKNIWDDGMQVGIHTYTHDYGTIYASTDAFWQDMTKCAQVIQSYIGYSPTLLRFPGGSLNDYDKSIAKTLTRQAAAKGYHYFDWNVCNEDSESATEISAAQIVRNVEKQASGDNSCCVLMHDTGAKDTTVEALPQIIEYFQKEGYAFEMLDADSYGYHLTHL